LPADGDLLPVARDVEVRRVETRFYGISHLLSCPIEPHELPTRRKSNATSIDERAVPGHIERSRAVQDVIGHAINKTNWFS
jgi:hypothetical protein